MRAPYFSFIHFRVSISQRLGPQLFENVRLTIVQVYYIDSIRKKFHLIGQNTRAVT